jgi:phosphohistidine swiveling domain-containing protein
MDEPLADPNDVFLLYLAEIRAGLSGANQQALAAERKAEMAAWSQIIPPPTIGEPPPPSDDPWEEAILRKMLGVPVEPSRDPDVITGAGASPGTVHGRATVVHNLSEASKVQSGDILVCEMTMPAWTPLFSSASAAVSDTDGVLSHCAIVSREYRIPCVVGTVVGTSVLKDGMLLTVDGSRGVVRIDARIQGRHEPRHHIRRAAILRRTLSVVKGAAGFHACSTALHGDLWYSWRHLLPALAVARYYAVAAYQRGYDPCAG